MRAVLKIDDFGNEANALSVGNLQRLIEVLRQEAVSSPPWRRQVAPQELVIAESVLAQRLEQVAADNIRADSIRLMQQHAADVAAMHHAEQES